MAKKRVHELAKELQLTNNEMVQRLQEWGYDNVKSHSSTLEDDQVRAVQERFRAGQKPAVAAKPSSGVVIRRPKPVGAAGAPAEHAPIPEAAAPAVAEVAPPPPEEVEPAAEPVAPPIAAVSTTPAPEAAA